MICKKLALIPTTDKNSFINLLKEYARNIDMKDSHIWNILCTQYNLSQEFIEEYEEYVNWKIISKDYKLTESFIEKYSHRINWTWVDYNRKLSDEFILKHFNKLCIGGLIRSHKLSDIILDKILSDKSLYISYIYDLIQFQKLPESFIEHLLSEKRYELSLFSTQNVPERILAQYINCLSFESLLFISKNYALSEDFIRKFQDVLIINHLLKNENIEITESLYEDLLKCVQTNN